MSWIQKLARSAVFNIPSYPIDHRDFNHETIYLNANENPWTVLSTGLLNRYPEQQPLLLKQKIAELYQVAAEQVLITRGSDEGIELLQKCFCQPSQDSIIVFPPSFEMFEITAKIHDINVIHVSLIKEQGFRFDQDGLQKQWRENCKLIFTVSPNNPTGSIISPETIEQCCQQFAKRSLIIVDEAYIEFSQQKSCSFLLKKYDNLVILRTFSKAYGLAGVRCGNVIANPEVIQLLQKIIPPYSMAQPVMDIVFDVLTNDKINLIKQQVNTLIEQREKMFEQLVQLPVVARVWPSQANFLLVEFFDVKKCLLALRQHHIFVRDRSNVESLANCARITIGTKEQNQKLIEVLTHVKK